MKKIKKTKYILNSSPPIQKKKENWLDLIHQHYMDYVHLSKLQFVPNTHVQLCLLNIKQTIVSGGARL